MRLRFQTHKIQNLRDLTLSELHKNSVRVLGKVTRVIPDGQYVSPFENYGMALIKPTTLQAALEPIVASENMSMVNAPIFQSPLAKT